MAVPKKQLANGKWVDSTIYVCCHECAKDQRVPGSDWLLVSAVVMILCPDCRNKRCPKASDHRLDCTGSNATGQPGSIYQ